MQNANKQNVQAALAQHAQTNAQANVQAMHAAGYTRSIQWHTNGTVTYGEWEHKNDIIDCAALAQHVQQVEGGYALCIDLQEQNVYCAGARVLSVSMYVSEDEEQWGGEELAVNWDASTLEYSDVQAVMQAFYSDAFTAQLREILHAAGFSKLAAQHVVLSEGSMQEEERASYDAGTLGEEVLTCIS